jgi:hypothetical protein
MVAMTAPCSTETACVGQFVFERRDQHLDFLFIASVDHPPAMPLGNNEARLFQQPHTV